MLSRLVISTARVSSRSHSLLPLVRSTPLAVKCVRFNTTTTTPPPSPSTPPTPPSSTTPPPTATPPTPAAKEAPKPSPQPAQAAPSTPPTPTSSTPPSSTTPPSTTTPPPPASGTTPGGPQISPDFAITGPPPPVYENVVAQRRGRVGLITLNRPKQLNALSDALIRDLQNALFYFQEDKDVGAMIITGSEKAFAAGADIKEMEKKTFVECYKTNMLAQWQDLSKIKKPIIAAVNGFALGGGCELAMLCDMIIAGENAMFGQPEVKLGTIPGCGGTQRLVRAVGKSKAMELILTGNQMNAHEAEKFGLVSRVVPTEKLLDEALRTASKIAALSQPIIAMAKETVNAAYEMSLQEGLRFERRLFHSTFATQDQKEGMSAFVEKRNPNWTNE